MCTLSQVSCRNLTAGFLSDSHASYVGYKLIRYGQNTPLTLRSAKAGPHLPLWQSGSLLQPSGHHVCLRGACWQGQGCHETRQLEQLEHDVVVLVLTVARTGCDEALPATLGHDCTHHVHSLLL